MGPDPRFTRRYVDRGPHAVRLLLHRALVALAGHQDSRSHGSVCAWDAWRVTVASAAITRPGARPRARVTVAECGRALTRRWRAGLVAVTVLLICVPSNDKDVSASVHVTPPDIGTVAF